MLKGIGLLKVTLINQLFSITTFRIKLINRFMQVINIIEAAEWFQVNKWYSDFWRVNYDLLITIYDLIDIKMIKRKKSGNQKTVNCVNILINYVKHKQG